MVDTLSLCDYVCVCVGVYVCVRVCVCVGKHSTHRINSSVVIVDLLTG